MFCKNFHIFFFCCIFLFLFLFLILFLFSFSFSLCLLALLISRFLFLFLFTFSMGCPFPCGAQIHWSKNDCRFFPPLYVSIDRRKSSVSTTPKEYFYKRKQIKKKNSGYFTPLFLCYFEVRGYCVPKGFVVWH